MLLLSRFLFVSTKKTVTNQRQQLTQSVIANLLTSFRTVRVFNTEVKNDRVNSGIIRACIATELVLY